MIQGSMMYAHLGYTFRWGQWYGLKQCYFKFRVDREGTRLNFNIFVIYKIRYKNLLLDMICLIQTGTMDALD